LLFAIREYDPKIAERFFSYYSQEGVSVRIKKSSQLGNFFIVNPFILLYNVATSPDYHNLCSR
jgi:hypothetical protein